MNDKSKRLQQMAFGVLRSALNKAKRQGLIRENPCANADTPTAPRPSIQAMTREQKKAFLEAAQTEPVMKGKEQIGTRPHRLYSLYVLAFSTGMRQGELLALQWSDVNLDESYLLVRNTLIEDEDGKLALGEPKTQQSKRRIELLKSDVVALRTHKEHMRAEGRWNVRKMRGQKMVPISATQAMGFVFCDVNGNALRRDNVRKRSFEPILQRAKSPHFRFHDIRHSCATLWSQAGIPLQVIAARLGHSTPRLTLERYAHATQDMQREAVDRLEAMGW
jgi:integrase